MEGDKPFYRSRTFWFNLMVVVLGFLQSQGALDVVSPDHLGKLAAVGNVLLRFITRQPLTVR